MNIKNIKLNRISANVAANISANMAARMIKAAICTSALLIGGLFSGAVLAGGDADAGKEASATCAACHGADGNSTIPTNPKLAGQYESYLVHALKAYRSGDRQNAIMSGFAAGLSDQQIADLAAYFSSQESDLQTVEPK